MTKFELRRLCKAIGATALARLGAPTPEEYGYCDSVKATEIGDTQVTIFTNSMLCCVVLCPRQEGRLPPMLGSVAIRVSSCFFGRQPWAAHCRYPFVVLK
jgi:hypothetical protein